MHQLERRCADGVACREVLDRLLALERARELGLASDDPAVAGLRRKAEMIAAVHVVEMAHRDRGTP
jgi:hypothetical protein